jgi:hypothetical protein
MTAPRRSVPRGSGDPKGAARAVKALAPKPSKANARHGRNCQCIGCRAERARRRGRA